MSQPNPHLYSGLSNSHSAKMKRLRSLTHILDNAIAIPGTRYRVGIDPILGLLPGAGDFIGTAFSGYIVLEAALMGLPRPTLIRMFYNIILDEIVGSIPVIGDFFDLGFKANVKNLALLEAHVATPQESKKADWLFILLLLGGLILFVVAITAISVFILRLLFQAING
ncbi:MAG TPA: DUF4112 domain-containing protein [Oculatellaceae cyanobacterium]|jgi:hypothetical protein